LRTETTLLIRAPLDDVYDLAAAVERWPALLPHYRYVHICYSRGRARLVEMAVRRHWIPVWWLAVQECHPDVPEISFRHVRGITSGLTAEWSFAARPDGVQVSIRHDFRPTWRLGGGVIAERIVGPLLVDRLAARTLGRIKAMAEARLAGRRQAGAGGTLPSVTTS